MKTTREFLHNSQEPIKSITFYELDFHDLLMILYDYIFAVNILIQMPIAFYFFFWILNYFWIICNKLSIWKIIEIYHSSFFWAFPLTRTYRYFALCCSYFVIFPSFWENFWSLSPFDAVCFFTKQCTISSATILHWHLLYHMYDTQTDQWPAPGKENHFLW